MGTTKAMSALTANNESYVSDMVAALQALTVGEVDAIGEAILEAYETGKSVYIVGNGGSAATASHMACDFCKTTLAKSHETISKRLRAIALTDNVPALTAWGNDVSYDLTFSEQLRTFANPGDLLIVITASGNSPNVLEALKAAKDLGMKTAGLLGFQGGKAKAMLDHSCTILSENYGVVEDMHSIVNHMLTQHLKDVISGLPK